MKGHRENKTKIRLTKSTFINKKKILFSRKLSVVIKKIIVKTYL